LSPNARVDESGTSFALQRKRLAYKGGLDLRRQIGKGADPGDNRPRVLGAGVDAAIMEALAISGEARAEQEADRTEWLAAGKPRDPRRPGVVRHLSRQEIAVEYAGQAKVADERLLAKRQAAYDKLDEINERWERRGRPKT
jgi:hypothetical protein